MILVSVSYTHLDVYKRQSQNCPRLLQFLPLAPKTFEETHGNPCAVCFLPVSYTHLDVYKRQVSGRYVIDAKSIMGIFSLDLSKDIDLNIHAEGEEAENCLLYTSNGKAISSRNRSDVKRCFHTTFNLKAVDSRIDHFRYMTDHAQIF